MAQFWNAFATNQTNTTDHGRRHAHCDGRVDAARSFATANMVDTDAGIACWDSKYRYQLWRPVTAIQHADIETTRNRRRHLDAAADHAQPPRIPGRARLHHRRRIRRTHGNSAHPKYPGRLSRRGRRGKHPHDHAPLRHRRRPAPRDHQRPRLGRTALPQLRPGRRTTRPSRRALRLDHYFQPTHHDKHHDDDD